MNEKREHTPLYDALKDYIDNDYLSFHTPGHCQGKWVEQELKKTFGKKVFKSDLTELPGLDNLHAPRDSIKRSQMLAAETFQADFTKFLVNGSTSGIVASILATTDQGEKILMPRNAHKSAYYGLILSGAVPEYISLKELNNGFPLNVDLKALRGRLEKNLYKALLLTTPSYYGVCIEDLKEIKNKAGNDMLMIVDEAHGAHLNFCKELVNGASKQGADIWIQSIHKNLGSLTQSAMLHWRENKIDSSKLELMLQLMQTTSPSYLLLLSLELARYNLEKNMHLWDDFIDRLIRFRKTIDEKIYGFKLLDSELIGTGYTLDITKLTLFTGKLGLTGYKVAKILKEDYNILVELSSYDHILFFMTPAHNNDEDLTYLLNALNDISRRFNNNSKLTEAVRSPKIPKLALNPGRAVKMKSRTIDLKEAAGKVSADFVVPYPPGIPILVPGEIITGSIIDHIMFIESMEGSFVEGVINFNQKRKGMKVIEKI